MITEQRVTITFISKSQPGPIIINLSQVARKRKRRQRITKVNHITSLIGHIILIQASTVFISHRSEKKRILKVLSGYIQHYNRMVMTTNVLNRNRRPALVFKRIIGQPFTTEMQCRSYKQGLPVQINGPFFIP